MINKWVIPMMMMICMACTVSLIMATKHLNSNTDLQADAQSSHIRHFSTQWESNLNDDGLFYTNIRQGK